MKVMKLRMTEEQNTLIDNFQNNEESKISEDSFVFNTFKDEIPTGVSIESASYIEKNEKSEEEKNSHKMEASNGKYRGRIYT